MIVQRDRFVLVFRELAGIGGEVTAISSAALQLLEVHEVRELLVVSPSGTHLAPIIRRDTLVDEETLRFVRALWAAFGLTYYEPLGEWEAKVLPFIGETVDGVLGPAALPHVWTALSLFRHQARKGALAVPAFSPQVFVSGEDRSLVLQLQFCCEVPDNETFSLGTAGELVDAWRLTDDEVRAALHAVWPDSDVWDQHLREIASA